MQEVVTEVKEAMAEVQQEADEAKAEEEVEEKTQGQILAERLLQHEEGEAQCTS